MTQAIVIDFHTYQDVEKGIFDVVDEAFTHGRFFTALREGKLSTEELRCFALQYAHYSRHFPRVLGAAISAMPPIDHWWVPLADNLWDEAGRGQAGRSHQKLYRTFLQSVAPDLSFDANDFTDTEMADSVAKAIRTFLQFFHTADPLEAMAAVGLGSELFAGKVMGMIAEGLRHKNYNQNHPLDVRFWDAHADEHEPRHYELCKDILTTYTSQKDLGIMFEVGRHIALSEARMYDEIYEESRTI